MEDQGSAVTEGEGDRGPGLVGEDSDEVSASSLIAAFFVLRAPYKLTQL